MRWSALATVLTAVAMAIGPGEAAAQEGVTAQECCVTLIAPIGARALALGNAVVARSVPDALFINPAATAVLPQGELRVHSERTDLANTLTLSLLFGIGSVGTAGFTYRLVDQGTQDLTLVGGAEPIGELHTYDQLLGVSFGTSMTRAIRAGVHYKLFQFRNDCTGACQADDQFSGTTHLLDLGLQADAPWIETLQLGASLSNLGPRMQVLNAGQADPPPARLRIGAAYEVLQHFSTDTTTQLIVSADLRRGIREDTESGAAIGFEAILDRSLFVRAGYATGTGQGSGGAVGVGLLYDRFDISVGKGFTFSEDATEAFQVTFAVRF